MASRSSGTLRWREAILSPGRHCSHVFCRVCAEEALGRLDAGAAASAVATGSSSSSLERQLSLQDREQLGEQRRIAASLESILTSKDVQVAALQAALAEATNLASERWKLLQALEAEHAQCKRQVATLEAESTRCKESMAPKVKRQVATPGAAETRKFRDLIARKSGDIMDLELEHQKCKEEEEDVVIRTDLTAKGEATRLEADYQDLLWQKDEVIASFEADYNKCQRLIQVKEDELKACKARNASLVKEWASSKKLVVRKDATVEKCLSVIVEKDGRILEKDRRIEEQDARIVSLIQEAAAKDASIASLQVDTEAHKDLVAEKDSRISILAAELKTSISQLDAARGERKDPVDETDIKKCSSRKRPAWFSSWSWAEQEQAAKRR